MLGVKDSLESIPQKIKKFVDFREFKRPTCHRETDESLFLRFMKSGCKPQNSESKTN